jgi:hypothetical protein
VMRLNFFGIRYRGKVMRVIPLEQKVQILVQHSLSARLHNRYSLPSRAKSM